MFPWRVPRTKLRPCLSGERPADIFIDPKKNSLSMAVSTIVADRFFTVQALWRCVVCVPTVGYFLRRFGRSGFRLRLVSGSHAEGKRPTGKSTSINVWEQAESTWRDIVSCQVLPYTNERSGLFLEGWRWQWWWRGQRFCELRWCCGNIYTDRFGCFFSSYWLELSLNEAQLRFFFFFLKET